MIFVFGACASKTKDKMLEFREVYRSGNVEKAEKILEDSGLKDEKNSVLLWHLEKGTIALAKSDESAAILEFQESLDLIDKLFTTKLKSKVASLLINDASDEFYGASYERSYAHYFLSRAYYARYLKTKNKLDLQGARGTILAWDSYFAELQRSASTKTFYQTDLMLKIFGGQIHEMSGIANDKQVALQLYKDGLRILGIQGGIFPLFNSKSEEYVKNFEEALATGETPNQKLFESTAVYQDLKNFITYKILVLTKEIRGGDFANQVKALNPSVELLKKVNEGSGNVVIVVEEGLVPRKIPKAFNIGLKGAMNATDNKGAKDFIAKVGAEVLANFAMNKLGMTPDAGAGGLMFAHTVTKVAVTEAAVEFELPVIEKTNPVERLEIFVTNSKGQNVAQAPLSVVSENGDIAKVVLEEDAVSRYVKTGTRVAIKHIAAIISAYGVYRAMKGKDESSNDFFAKTAALATYVGASKGLSMLERADTRYWASLPDTLRMSEFKLSPGEYRLGVARYESGKAPRSPSKDLGKFHVSQSGKELFVFKF